MAIVNPSSSSIYPIDKRMNAYDIEIEYDEENDNYYAEHEFAYPSKRVRLNIDTDNSLWPTDEDNEMTITIPSTPQTDANNTWNDTTKTLTLTNLDQNTLITNNQNPTFNYATDLNINLSNYQPTPSSTKINILSFSSASTDYPDQSSTYFIKDMIIKESSGSISVPSYKTLFYIKENYSHYNIYNFANSTSNSVNKTIDSGSKYIIIDGVKYYIYLYDNNNNLTLSLYDYSDDTLYNTVKLYKTNFNIILN